MPHTLSACIIHYESLQWIIYLIGLQMTFTFNKLNKTKKIKVAGIADQQKVGEQCRDDSIKQFSTQSTLPNIFPPLQICRVGLYTELLYAIIGQNEWRTVTSL